jgi:hypothetical protein
MLLMSGAASPLSDAEAVAIPPAGETAGAWRATMMRTAAKSPASDTPAMIHGVRSDPVAVPPPAGWPHAEQKRAAGETCAPQLEQAALSLTAPQLEQNLPDPGFPHAGQAGDESVIECLLSGTLELASGSQPNTFRCVADRNANSAAEALVGCSTGSIGPFTPSEAPKPRTIPTRGAVISISISWAWTAAGWSG